MIGGLAFLNPWMLAALLALPLIWLILRLTPPRPRRINFPPTLLLFGLDEREQTPAKTPWWLTLIRMLLIGAIMIALAKPVFRPDAPLTTGSGPLILVFDNGWDTAPTFQMRVDTAAAILAEAKREGRPVAFVATAEDVAGGLILGTAVEAENRLAAISPRAFLPGHAAISDALQERFQSDSTEVIWIAGAIDAGGTRELADTLGGIADAGQLITANAPTVILYPPENTADGIEIEMGALGNSGPVTVLGFDGRGRRITQTELTFDGNGGAAATVDLPVELRNALTKLTVAGHPSAGAVQLLDSRWRRKSVGLIAGEFGDAAQPLLAPLTYVQSALSGRADVLAPPASTITQSIDALIQRGVSVIVLSETGSLPPQSLEAISRWIEAGGTLVRFASPKLTGAQPELLPVPLREGERALGGSLSWEEPRPIGSFDPQGPFARIEVPEDVRVTRQILADPKGISRAEVWADLTDGTPLVTAKSIGAGRIVLFHVTADPRWSNLPISGAFVEMFDAIVRSARSSNLSSTPQNDTPEARALPWSPTQILDGYGNLMTPDSEANLVTDLEDAVPSAKTPPGFYERAGNIRALNAVPSDTTFEPPDPSDMSWAESQQRLEPRQSVPLWPWALGLAALLALLDGIAVLALAGRLIPARLSTAATALAIFVSIGIAPDQGLAQTADGEISTDLARKALQATLKTRLAYVITGNPILDETSRAGLSGLTAYLAGRTAMEPGEPIGVDIAVDELAFYPFLYWPLDTDSDIPGADVMARVDTFMKNGGTILFDTRDSGGAVSPGTSGVSAETEKLRAILSFIDVPPLEPVPPDHVLTKAFYLLNHFPGRWEDSELWVESLSDGAQDPDRPARGGDGVSPIIISGNDFASAWAVGPDGRYLYPTVPATPRQRELALRSGVNIVMYTMTGNYKADQVHVPALLERLGQ